MRRVVRQRRDDAADVRDVVVRLVRVRGLPVALLADVAPEEEPRAADVDVEARVGGRVCGGEAAGDGCCGGDVVGGVGGVCCFGGKELT